MLFKQHPAACVGQPTLTQAGWWEQQGRTPWSRPGPSHRGLLGKAGVGRGVEFEDPFLTHGEYSSCTSVVAAVERLWAFSSTALEICWHAWKCCMGMPWGTFSWTHRVLHFHAVPLAAFQCRRRTCCGWAGEWMRACLRALLSLPMRFPWGYVCRCLKLFLLC